MKYKYIYSYENLTNFVAKPENRDDSQLLWSNSHVNLSKKCTFKDDFVEERKEIPFYDFDKFVNELVYIQENYKESEIILQNKYGDFIIEVSYLRPATDDELKIRKEALLELRTQEDKRKQEEIKKAKSLLKEAGEL